MENKELVLKTLNHQSVPYIPTAFCNIMEHRMIERIAGVAPGDYRKDPEEVYIKCQQGIGVSVLDQFIPQNPLVMMEHGYQQYEKGPTTGAEQVVLDGVVIDSPEAVVSHMEYFVFPHLIKSIKEFDEEKRIQEIIEHEEWIQTKLGPDILKAGYGFIAFPALAYATYGYQNYFMAYALYPEVIERHFSLQADLALLNNVAAAKAYQQGELIPLYRLDHDMADSRGTLVSIKTLEKLWFPHFERSIAPLLETGVKLIWHCDGNLMEMVPRLLEVGVAGFQGFQYEDGMDYPKICRMKTREGKDLIIWAGISVTRTLPFGKPHDVKKEMDWLVKNGPKKGLFLGISSSMVPGVPWENIQTLLEGFRYYRIHGR